MTNPAKVSFVFRRAARFGLPLLLAFLLSTCDQTTIVVVPVSSVTITPSSNSITTGNNVQLSAMAKGPAGRTLTGRTVTWSTGNGAVASVDGNGTVTGVFTGDATITATIDGIQGSTTVTVSGSITTNSLDDAEVNTSYSRALTAHGGSGTYSWSVASGSLPAGLVLSSSGVISGTPTRLGRSDFTVQVTSGGASETKALSITVEGMVNLASGAVSLDVPAGALPSEVEFTAEPTTAVPDTDLYVPGSAYEIGPSGTAFAVPATLTLSYDPSGLPEGVLESELRLHKVVDGSWVLMEEGDVDSVSSTVSGSVTSLSRFGARGLAVGSIDVSPTSPTLEQWSTVQLTATPRANDGTVLAKRPVHWTSDDELVATVDRDGLVTAVGPGTTTIEVMSGGIRVNIGVTVTAPTVSQVLVTPTSVTLAPSETQQLTATALHVSGAEISGKTASWSSDNTSVATVSSAGLLTAVAVGSATITATIDGVSGTAQVAVAEIVVAQVVVSPATATLVTGQTQQLAATTYDGDGNVLTGRPLSWSSDNTSIASVDVNGLVMAQGPGTATISAMSGEATGTAAITVFGVLEVTTSSLPDGELGTPYDQVLSAQGGDGTYTWSIASGAPPDGLALNGGTGRITGTPTTAGTTPFSVRVQSGDGQSATKDLSITVIQPPLSITTEILPDGEVGTAYDQTLAATGGDGTYTWSLASGSLPDGLGLAGATGQISGTPTAVGDWTFTVQVVSGIDTAVKEFSIAVVLPPLEITTAVLADGVTGAPYGQTVTASGGDGTYTWSITDGQLPDGLNLTSNTGEISGTPTAAGTFDFTIEVTSGGETDTADLSITVADGGTGLGVGFGDDQFSLIQAGTFQMGDITGNGDADELPVHTVNITQDFYMQKTEVTQGQWRAVMGSNPSLFSDCGDTCPVEEVSWNDIQDFLAALNALYPGRDYRLPTEAEWEYAARAGTTGDYGGTGVLDEMGWYRDNSAVDGTRQTHPAAQKQPNAWGLYDMHGNVWEWVQDWYGNYPSEAVTDPMGPASGSDRVLRGGSWHSFANIARSAYRYEYDPSARVIDYGFRLARGGGPPPNDPPTAQFDVSCTDLSCDFTDQSTDSDGSIQSWSWNFGDGGGSNAENPSHTYASAGTFTVTLTVTDDDGATDTATESLTVTDDGSGDLGTGFGDEQFALIQAGSFQMGDIIGNGDADERPVHTVNITQDFYMQKTEVTQGQWRAVMGSNPSFFSDCGDTCPVDRVSWNDIQDFLAALNALYPGRNYRLPTEAEWEYAARAGTTGDYGGTGVLDEMGWYRDNSGDQTHPVARKQPNDWGLYDMHGNVWEWVQDWYRIYSSEAVTDPVGPATGTHRVCRGGSWVDFPLDTRSSRRCINIPSFTDINFGFRLARTP